VLIENDEMITKLFAIALSMLAPLITEQVWITPEAQE
jgi:hypothetical protein